MNYADTGFLVSLYLQEVTSAEAVSVTTSLSEPIEIVSVTELEFENAIHRAEFNQRITSAEGKAIQAQFESDMAAGVYHKQRLDMDALFIEASVLAAKHTPQFGTRTLDLLHVAAANMLQCTRFLSFDRRQRQSASALGMEVLPTMNK
jgi:predicted nucleic acid-binding protein